MSQTQLAHAFTGDTDAAAITRQLSLVLGSPRFRRSPTLQRILKFVVEETLRGGDGLSSATAIATRALGKDETFRSSRDASVRVAINRLRTGLELYYANEGITDDVIIKMTPGSNHPIFAFRSPEPVTDCRTNALRLARAYQEILTRDANCQVLLTLQAAIELNPDDPAILCAYIDICLDSYKNEFNTVTNPLEAAHHALERAESIDPGDPAVMLQRGTLAIVEDDLKTAMEVGRRLVRDNPDDPDASMMGSWLLSLTMDPVLAVEELNLDLSDVGHLPGWAHLARYLAAYQQED